MLLDKSSYKVFTCRLVRCGNRP